MSQSARIAALADTVALLGPYPTHQNLINPQHFYQNSILLSWAKQTPHPVTLRHLANFGRRLTQDKIVASANFVRSEVPLRLSLKIKELQNMPFGVVSNYHLSQVYQSYYHCFNAFRKVPEIKNMEDNEQFCKFVSSMLKDHLIVLPHLMMGALEVSALGLMTQDSLDAFMSSMLRSRISRRVIMDQHYSMSQSFMDSVREGLDQGDRPPDFVGEAFQYLSAHEQLRLSYDSISKFLRSQDPTLVVPELVIKGEDVKFQYLTNHLNYILTEVIRNGLKSTIDQNKAINAKRAAAHPSGTLRAAPIAIPPLVVEITNLKKEIYFKFSDQGGGVPLAKLPKVWSFGKSPELARGYLHNFHDIPGLNLTQRLPIVDHDYLNPNSTAPPPLEGVLSDLGNMEVSNSPQDRGSMLSALSKRPFKNTLGISLPMCRVYANYWNGELSMDSVEGYGTDVVWKIRKLNTLEAEGSLDRA